MDQIEIWNGASKAIISIDGAWLTNLSDQSGQVLFPKRTLQIADGTAKTRGGAHVCLPNFGPGGLSDQPQHGYGRTQVWQVMQQTQSSVTLELPNGTEEYESMSSTITYTLRDGSIDVAIKASNNGQSDLRLAPGLHPYFAITDDETTIEVNGQTYYIDELEGTEFIQSQQVIIRMMRRTITMRSDNLTTWALWSDLIGRYVCVEPTYKGYAFDDQDDAPIDELLPPGQQRKFNFTLDWTQ